MLLHELIVGHIRIEGPNHVVAVAIRAENVVVELMPRRFRESHQIQPMSGPPFPVVFRRQQPLDQPVVSRR